MDFKRLAISQVIRYAVSLIVLVIAWEAASHIFHIPSYLLPSCSQVFQTLISEHSYFWSASVYTATHAYLGALLGVTLGGGFAILLAAARPIRWLMEPYLIIFQSFPRESLLPLMVTWLGFGAVLKVTSSTLLCFFPTVMVLLPPLMNVRKDYLSLLGTWGAAPFQVLWHLRVPYPIPAFISAIKLAVPLSLIGSVLGEFMGGNNGLGYIIMYSGSSFRTDRIFVGILSLCVIGLAGGIVVNVGAKLFAKHYYEED